VRAIPRGAIFLPVDRHGAAAKGSGAALLTSARKSDQVPTGRMPTDRLAAAWHELRLLRTLLGRQLSRFARTCQEVRTGPGERDRPPSVRQEVSRA
jgi:hypothetical protein